MNKSYNAVPANGLEILGVKDVMRVPADGVNRSPWILWDTAQLAVAANFEDTGKGEKPNHEIVVNNADGQGNNILFDTEQLDEGSVSVATVSGGHSEGRATLNEEQSAAFKALVDASIEAGLRH